MSSEDSNSHTKPEIGRMLERARVERGLSIWQVEDATKIRARYLHDLERENFDVLPAVYVLGSLKTYADYLGLDGEALARQLKDRQEPPPEELDPTPEEPTRSERGGFLASLGSLPVIRGRDAVEDDEGATPAAILGYGPRLYLGLGAVLILVLAVALGTAFGDGGKPAVSQVREPAISEAPSRIAFSGDAQDGRDERNQGAKGKDDRPGEEAESPNDGDEKDEKDQAEKSDQDDTRPEDTADVAVTLPTSINAVGSTASASASASASATAPATSTPAATAPGSAPSAASVPANTPAATAAPETENPGVAPTQPPSRPAPATTGAPGGSRQAEPGNDNKTRLTVRIVRKVRSATSGAR